MIQLQILDGATSVAAIAHERALAPITLPHGMPDIRGDITSLTRPPPAHLSRARSEPALVSRRDQEIEGPIQDVG